MRGSSRESSIVSALRLPEEIRHRFGWSFESGTSLGDGSCSQFYCTCGHPMGAALVVSSLWELTAVHSGGLDLPDLCLIFTNDLNASINQFLDALKERAARNAVY